jgi:diguanylate cyclase (GGDEF)-like protein
MLNQPPKTDNSEVADESGQTVTGLLESAEKIAETDVPAALALVEKALAETGGSGYERLDELTAACFHLQGRLFINNSEYRSGLISFSKAQAIYEALGNTHGAAVELCFIGVAQAYVGLYADGLRNLFEALVVFETNDNLGMISKTLNAIGYTYVLLEEPTRGLPHLLRAAEIARDLNVRNDLANTLHSLGDAYLGIGDLESALKHSAESVEICREDGALIKQAEYLLGLGSIHVARGDKEQAENCFQSALSLARNYGYRFAECGALRRLGLLAHEQRKDSALATSLLDQALTISQEIGANPTTCLVLNDLASVCKETRDFEAALSYLERYQVAKEAIFTEQAEFRVKSLEVAYKLKETTKEKEIFYLKNVALQREVEERMKAQAMAEQLAITDSLTGMFNRRQLLDLAQREVVHATRYKRELSLVIFDLDHFKRVNDNFGHIAGDKVLVAVSQFVQNSVRKCDIMGRYGGEEFAILLPETGIHKAMAMFERIRTAVASMTIDLDRNVTSVTISAGISQVHLDTQDSLEQLLDRADQALYVAKKNGRNQTQVFQEKV